MLLWKASSKQVLAFTQANGRFRFVTKYTDVDSLLAVKHEGHTRFRFSLNEVVDKFEHSTPPRKTGLLRAVKC
jgi:spore photoproduct lyase